MEKLTQEQENLLKSPLPAEAVTQHPTKTYLSSIKAIYVTERLNDVFGIWVWQVRTDFVENAGNWMVVVKTKLEVPSYGIYYECFWGNDNWWETNKNFDLWDAYKWATTDAITKICSYMWIWANVFKGKQKWGWNNTSYTNNEEKRWLMQVINDMKKATTVEDRVKFKDEWKTFAKSEKQLNGSQMNGIN